MVFTLFLFQNFNVFRALQVGLPCHTSPPVACFLASESFCSEGCCGLFTESAASRGIRYVHKYKKKLSFDYLWSYIVCSQPKPRNGMKFWLCICWWWETAYMSLTRDDVDDFLYKVSVLFMCFICFPSSLLESVFGRLVFSRTAGDSPFSMHQPISVLFK